MGSKAKECTGMLNSDKTRRLFEQEAFLIGTTDAIPIQRVTELFGAKAAEFGRRLPGRSWNAFGVGDYDLYYLTYKGFQMAATYHNIAIARDEERGIPQ